MELTILGTGNAMATGCYNTCFALREGGEVFLVDAGGGNGILSRLEQAGIGIGEIGTIFVTHKHIDHLLGAVWLLRVLCQRAAKGKLTRDVTLYGHAEVVALLEGMAKSLLQESQYRQLGGRIRLEAVADGETRTILGCETVFFDIRSTKARQFGFSIAYAPGRKLTCCGDEPYNPCEEPYARGSTWLLHEAFCLFAEADRFSPYELHHSTVKEACELAERLGAEHLILYHTEDSDLAHRKARYTAEGSRFYRGALYVPDDLERFVL